MTANILYSDDHKIIAHDPNILYKDDTIVVLAIYQIDEIATWLMDERQMHNHLVKNFRVRLNEEVFYVHQLYCDVRSIDAPRLQNICRSRPSNELKMLRWALEIDLVSSSVSLFLIVFVLELLTGRKIGELRKTIPSEAY